MAARHHDRDGGAAVSPALYTALGRARVAVMVAGLAWFFGLDAGVGSRVAIAVLVAVAIGFDALVDSGRFPRPAAVKDPPTTRYRTTA